MRESFNQNAETTLFVEGIFDSISTGILIYVSTAPAMHRACRVPALAGPCCLRVQPGLPRALHVLLGCTRGSPAAALRRAALQRCWRSC